MDFELVGSAGKEEVYAYFLLHDLFPNGKVYVGDDGTQKLPDIYSADRKWGLEVTTCEDLTTYDVIKPLAFGKVAPADFDINKLKFVNKGLPRLKRADTSKLQDSVKQAKYTTHSKKDLDFVQQFEFVLNKKLYKLNIKGSYNGVKQKNLIIISDFVPKNANIMRIYKTIYDRVVKNYATPFDKTFISVNNEVYVIDKVGEMKKIKDRKNVKAVKENLNYEVWEDKAMGM